MTLSRITQLKIILLWVIIALLCWHALRPFLAERNYREGFNNTAIERYSIAIQQLEKAVAYAPWEPHYRSALGKAYEGAAQKRKSFQQKDRLLRKAADAYMHNIDLDDNNPWYRNRLAVTALKIADLHAAENPNADEHHVWFQLAEQSHFKGAQIDPNNPLFQLNLAFFLHKTQRYKEAIPFYERTLAIDDRMLEAPYNLADIYNRLGNPEKMVSYYLFVYERDPAFSNTLLALASYYLQENNNAQALVYLEQCDALKEPNKRVLQNLLAIYDEYQQYEKAVPIYEKLFRRFPDNIPAYHTHYVRTLLQVGHVSKAIASLKRYTAQFPKDKEAANQLKTLQRQ